MRRPLAYFLLTLGVSFVLTAVGPHALAMEDSTFSTIDFPGGTFTVALDISSSGEIVGSYNDTKGTHGFLLSRSGQFMAIDSLALTLPVPRRLIAAVTLWERTGFPLIR